MRTQNSIKLMILPLLLSACSQGFQTLDSSSSSKGNQKTPQEQAQSANASSDTIVTGRGELKTSKRVLSNKTTELNFEMNIPFGRVYSTLSSVVRTAAPYTCKLSGDIYSEGVDAYAPGEIPCGVPYNQDWKRITDIHVDEFRKSGSTETKVWAFDMPILLSRAQYKGVYTETRLDNRREENLTSSLGLGEDISIRYVPDGQKSRTELCMNIPGAAVRAPEVNVKARVRKKILGVRVSKTADFRVNPGQAKYDFGRGCFALDTAWVEGKGFTTDFSSTVKPHLEGVRYEGFNIKIKDWFLKLIDKLMSFFKKSIREKIIKQVRSTVNKIADQDIETGEWFTRIHGEEILEKGGQKFNQKARAVIARIGAPANKAEFKEMLADNCRLIKFGSDKWNKRLETFCSDVVDRLDFHVIPFVVDAKSKELGCYDGFANIHTTKVNGSAQWWSTQCKFSAKVTVKIDAAFVDYVKEMREVLELHISQKQIPEKWNNDLEKLQLNAFKLGIVLKELESRGVSQINDHDWQTTIPELVGELREKDLLD